MPFSGAEFKPCCFYCAVEWSRSVPIFIANCMHTTCGKCTTVPKEIYQEIRCRHCSNMSRLVMVNEKAPQAVKELFMSVRPVLRSMSRALGLQRALRRSLIKSHERILHRAHEKLAKVDEACSYWKSKINELGYPTMSGPSPRGKNNIHPRMRKRRVSPEGASKRARLHERESFPELTARNSKAVTNSVSPGILRYPPNTPLTGSGSADGKKRVKWLDHYSTMDRR